MCTDGEKNIVMAEKKFCWQKKSYLKIMLTEKSPTGGNKRDCWQKKSITGRIIVCSVPRFGIH